MRPKELKTKKNHEVDEVLLPVIEKIILETREDEQRRIGQELHDNICQQLMGAALLSKTLAQQLTCKAPKEAAKAAEIAELLNLAAGQTRDLSRILSPAEITADGLVPALQKFSSTIDRIYNISCVFDNDKASKLPDLSTPSAATHLYRIVQEAVNNAIRHGKAKRVIIALTTGESYAVLMIRDNGSGLPPDAFKKEGLGLRSMRSRAKMIDATLKVYRNPLGETVVSCTFPYPSKLSLETAPGVRNYVDLKIPSAI